MAFCTNCGANNPDGVVTCSRCGASMGSNAQQVPYPGGYATSPQQFVAPISTGGILAWAIITLLLCTIPGIVAIVKTTGINKSYTVEEQQQKLSSAKTWCIVGTVLGVLAVIITIIGGVANA